MSTPIQITLLGAPAITYQGEPLLINRSQIRSLLFRLAAQSEPLPRDLLAQLFWPNTDDAQARRHLTQLLSHIRRTLPIPTLLIQNSSHVHLDWSHVWSDVVAFKVQAAQPSHITGVVLQAAIDLYAGPFLDGISTPDLPEYELWLQNERAWLEQRYLELLELRTHELVVEEAFLPAIELLLRHLATDELAETAHRRLIACYGAIGDRRAALRHYQRCAALLRQELNVAPMAETVTLYQAVCDGATWQQLRSLVLLDSMSQQGSARAAATSELISPAMLPPAQLENLPHEPLPIIGRSAELATLASLLSDSRNRLTTIVGVGGMGKTRLALAAAWEQHRLRHFMDGIYFVSLAPLSDPAQIVPTILQTLHLSPEVGTAQRRTALEQLLGFLREKQMLLLLDNFEHLLSGVDVVTQIVHTAPGVHLLVTSRKALGVYGEQLFPLSELPYPTARTASNGVATNGAFADPASYPAMQLFVESAHRRTPSFVLTEGNQVDVVRICQLVGGMPLALELAASWITMLSTAEIGVEIAHSLDFLEAEIQDMPARHQSISALLAAILQQLNVVEQAAFARLATFQGGFTRQAATEIAGASLRTLRSLTANLLIRYNETNGRYTSHELLHSYGAEQLAAQPSVLKEVRERHSRYYSALLVRLAPELKGARQQHAFAELVADQANLQLAWEWALAQDDLPRLEECVTGLGQFYEWIGNQIEGSNIFSALVNRLEATEQGDAEPAGIDDKARGRRARLLAQGFAWLANFTLMAGNVAEAEAQIQRSLSLLDAATALGMDCRRQRALTLLYQGHLERPCNLVAAAQSYAASRALYEQIDLPWERAYAVSWLGETQHLMGRQEAAIDLLTQARHTFEELGDRRNVARVLATVADCYLLDQADLNTAAETAAASLRLWRASGDQLGIANSAVILSYAHCWLNRPDLAEPLIDEALAIYRHHGHRYGECRVYDMVMVVANYRSDIERKEESARQGLRLARELGDAKLISDFSRGLANVYLTRGDHERAYALHVEAIAVQEEAGVKTLLPWLRVVRAYSSWKLGKWDEARDHLAYALRISAENADIYTAVHALFFVVQVLHAAGKLELAVELHALAQRDYIWHGSLTGDVVFVNPLHDLDATLPPALVVAARVRGRHRDLFTTVAQLATAIQEPSWQWGKLSH